MQTIQITFRHTVLRTTGIDNTIFKLCSKIISFDPPPLPHLGGQNPIAGLR